jgi:predicted  nucleic acid-binding Zn-ribbon protein
MSDEEDGIEITVQMTRGTSTDDRDKIKASVAAADVEELDAKMGRVQERLERWADDLREIQPTERRGLDEDQATLGESEGSA